MSLGRHEGLNQAVASLGTLSVAGHFYRFTTAARLKNALDGSDRGGRWGPPGAFRVLYLADDYDSCVIEAHRHVSDTSLDPVSPPIKLGLMTCDVDVTNVLDLTRAAARADVGLEPAILFSEPQGPLGAAYQACSTVAQVAHQIGFHGILVPAATQRGNTLALFSDLLPQSEKPRHTGGTAVWSQLPADPRTLRVVRSESPRH